jgi:hypothetical protein
MIPKVGTGFGKVMLQQKNETMIALIEAVMVAEQTFFRPMPARQRTGEPHARVLLGIALAADGGAGWPAGLSAGWRLSGPPLATAIDNLLSRQALPADMEKSGRCARGSRTRRRPGRRGGARAELRAMRILG